MINETCHLPNFIEKVIKREFRFDNAVIIDLLTYVRYENCPHIGVNLIGDITLLNASKKQQLKEVNVNLKLKPSGQECDFIIRTDMIRNDNLDCRKSKPFYTDVRYKTSMNKTIDLAVIGYEKYQPNEKNKETLEIRVWNTHENNKDEVTKTYEIGTAFIDLDDALWNDGKIHEHPLFNEFNNKVGNISIIISFYNQHLPLAKSEISVVVWNKVLESLVSILSKQNNLMLLNEPKTKPFTTTCFHTKRKELDDFYLDVSCQQENVVEFRNTSNQNESCLPNDDSFIVNMYVNGKLAFEFNKNNNIASFPINNTLIGNIEFRVYRVIQEKKRVATSKKTPSILSALTPRRLTVKRRSFDPQLRASTESFCSLRRKSSCHYLENEMQQQYGNMNSSDTVISIERSVNELSSTGSIRRKKKKLKYELVFQTQFQISDVPWRNEQTGGIDRTYMDNELCCEFKWHVELLHSSQNSTNTYTEAVLNQEVAQQLLWYIYHAELNGMTETTLSKWDGTFCSNAQNVLAILAPHFRFTKWKTMIGWTLLKLQPLFTQVNIIKQIKEFIQAIELENLNKENSTLIANFGSFCLHQLSHFDVTKSLLGSLSSKEYLQDLINTLNVLVPKIDLKWKDELKQKIMKVLMNTANFHQIFTPQGTLDELRSINESLLEGYVFPNLEFISTNVEKQFGDDLWRPVLAQSILDVILPILQNKLCHFQTDHETDASFGAIGKEESGYKMCGILSLKLYKHVTRLLKIADIKENSEEFQQFYHSFGPCLNIWAHNCAMKAQEQVNVVIKLEENKDLTFNSYRNVDVTDSVSMNFANIDAMQGAIEVKGIFHTAQITWSDINWLTPGRSLEFGKNLYKRLYSVFQTYVQKLHEMVLRDNEFWPHELNYILKSMFHSASFLDRFLDRIQNELGANNHDGSDNLILSRGNSTAEDARKTLQGLRDTMVHAFCKGQKQHLLYFLKYWQQQNPDRKEIYDRLCGNNYSFHGYIHGLLYYFEENLLQDIEDENLLIQLKHCNQILKENIIIVGEHAIQQYYAETVKPLCDNNAYENLLKTVNEIKQQKAQYDVTGNPSLMDDIEKEINLKLSSTHGLVSKYLGAYCNLLTDMSHTDPESLNCVGEICFNVGLKDNRLYVSLKSVNNLVPRPGYVSCSFSLHILLLPMLLNKTDCIESKWTPMVDDKINYLFDIASPIKLSTKTSRPTLLKTFTFSGLPKFTNKLEAYTIDFELESIIDEPPKYLELRLYDHTLGSLIKHFRGHLILPLTKPNVCNIKLLDDFLYGCNEKYKICGKFTRYLEESHQRDTRVKVPFNELCFRTKDAIACNFIKSRKSISSTYTRKR